MKKIILILFVIIQSVYSFAQNDFAPIGAKWYYENIEGMMPPAIGYIVFESTKDSLVNHITYKVITTTYYSHLNTKVNQGIELTRYDSGKVYSLYNNKEYLLYDFNLMVGDTFKVYMRNRTYCNQDTIYPLRVDTVGQIIINSQKLNYQYLSTKDSSMHGYNLRIYERLGCTNFMFPNTDSYCIEDAFEPGPLRCYSDSLIGLYKRFPEPCDTVINEHDIIKEIDISTLNICPNPVKDGFYLKLNNMPVTNISNVAIFNLSDIEILSTVVQPKTVVDISKLSPSIYILRVNYEGKIFYTKLIKY